MESTTAPGERCDARLPPERRIAPGGKNPSLRIVSPLVDASERQIRLDRARCQAAVVRALLDEFERTCALQHGSTRDEIALGEQLVEDLARLGCRVLECASVMSLALPDGMIVKTNVARLPSPTRSLVEVDGHAYVGPLKACK